MISPQRLSELRWPQPNVPWRVACELVSGYVPTLCINRGMVSPLGLHWVKDACLFRCNLPPALLAQWSGSFTCLCGNMGVGRTPNKSQHTKLTLEKKFLPPLLPGFELATFRSRVRRSYQQATSVTRCSTGNMWPYPPKRGILIVSMKFWFLQTCKEHSFSFQMIPRLCKCAYRLKNIYKWIWLL